MTDPRHLLYVISRKDLYDLRHHMHFIPVKQGFSDSIARRLTGHRFVDACRLLDEVGVWIRDTSHFSGVDVNPWVKEVCIFHGPIIDVMEFTEEEMAERTVDPDKPTINGGGLIRLDPDEPDTFDKIGDFIRQIVTDTPND